MTYRTRTDRRRRAALCAATLLALAAVPGAAAAAPAKLNEAHWVEPDAGHDFPPHGRITALRSHLYALTKLPPPAEITRDLTMVVEVTFDTTAGTDAAMRLRTRGSGILEVGEPEGVKDQKFLPSAIEGTTATVRFTVKARADKLRILQPVYYEAITVIGPGRGARTLRWTFMPSGKHDEQLK